MLPFESADLIFEIRDIQSRYLMPDGQSVERKIEVRTNPVTGRTSRISYSRVREKEAGTATLPPPPPDADRTGECPFCRPNVFNQTPILHPSLTDRKRLTKTESVLFPNLYPYGQYSAVSLIDNQHFVEIGRASVAAYTDCLCNCQDYLKRVIATDPDAIYLAITQNHLPSAGGSLVHPHLQINADSIPANHQSFLDRRSRRFHEQTGDLLFSVYLNHEKSAEIRFIGPIGDWQWVAAFAPEGFFEIWGILPGVTSFGTVTETQWRHLADSICRIQRFYRSLNRNGYNLGILSVESGDSCLELRAVLTVRSNFAPWVRNDHTGYEVMLGDMTTFEAPETTARRARAFFQE